MYSHGFLKVASASPKLQTGNVKFNVNEILKCLEDAQSKKASVVVFPEMCIVGYSVNDLVYQEYLYQEAQEGLLYLLQNNKFEGVFIVGTFFKLYDAIYNCAVVCKNNKVLGVVPKNYLDNTKGKAESRYFTSGLDYPYSNINININGEDIPFGLLTFVSEDLKLSFGVEVGNDIFDFKPMHEYLYIKGASIVFNTGCSEYSLGSKKYLKDTIKAITHKVSGAYVYASNNSFESSSEVLFDNYKVIIENGDVLEECNDIDVESNVIYADIDIEKLHYIRSSNGWIKNASSYNSCEVEEIYFNLEEEDDFEFENDLDLLPFVPKTNEECKEIIEVQATSVYKRLKHIGIEKTVIGVSGGLDSTLALLSLAYMCDKYNIDKKNIIAITLPSGNNSDRTYNNALKLMEGLGVSAREVNIKDYVMEGLKAIGHDSITKDVTYENAQARYRTYILMNTANLEGGLVIGTGDMSEVALGWSTFNGDQMAMYGMNAGLPKTAIKVVTKYFENIYPELRDCINDVIGTPISPELKGNQLTEDIIGKYEINDFILYHFLVNGDSPERIVYLLKKFFKMDNNQAIDYVNNFNKRFYSQQFKRLTMPEGVKLLNISLSPRSELRLNGDIYKKPLEKK